MTAPNKNEGLIARLRDAGSTPFGHFAGEPEGTLALFHIADVEEAARAIQDLEEEVGRLTDKVEGLDSDLRSAVQVAYRRGATEWARLNYPQWIGWLEGSDALAYTADG